MPKTMKQLQSDLAAIEKEWAASSERWDRLMAKYQTFAVVGIAGCLVTLAACACVIIAGTP